MTYELRDSEPYVMGQHVAWHSQVQYHNLDDEMGYDGRGWHYRFRGFHVPLENGLILSTQWGTGNYCANYELLRATRQIPPNPEFYERCPDAELACWWDAGDGGRGDDSMLEWPDGDTVRGYFPAVGWWELIELLAEVPTRGTIKNLARVKELSDI